MWKSDTPLTCAHCQKLLLMVDDSAVEEAVARIRLYSDDPADSEQRVVDHVQQWLHDTSGIWCGRRR